MLAVTGVALAGGVAGLRRLTASSFGTLMRLEPAIALLAGLLVLRQASGPASAAGVILVVIAGIGATRTGDRQHPAVPQGGLVTNS